MITLKGKATFANVMLEERELEENTKAQIQTLLDHPAMRGSYIAIMPDCHVGAGCVIGFTSKMNNYVLCQIIGVDLGCGVIGYDMGKKGKDIDRKSFDKLVRRQVPIGKNRRQKPLEIVNNESVAAPWREVCKRIGLDYSAVSLSVGTLGGGNHFIEIDVDEEDNAWLFVHSGSRHFGLRIATYWQGIAEELCKKFFVDVPKGLEFLPLDLGGSAYLKDMVIAQEYAILNRLSIIKEIIGEDFNPIPDKTLISSVHNYIDFDGIIRKGAISAKKDEVCIIPFNMKDGIAICKGKGNSAYNFSSPHGAGRLHSRSAMRKQLEENQINVANYKKELEDAGVYSTSVGKETIDEMWTAYKSKEMILKQIEPTVEVTKMLKTIWNLKASE